MARKRIIYQSEALFVGPSGGGSANQLHRVQDISHTVDVPRTDILEFDRLAALSREIIEAPTVGLDFTYYVVDGTNESGLGFAVWGNGVDTEEQMLSGMMGTDEDIKSYYILTAPEGQDAAGYGSWDSTSSNIISVGNGGITSYGVEAAVGDIPTASVSVEGANIQFMTGNKALAHTIQDDGSIGGSDTTISSASTGNLQAMALRPGDISLSFGTAKFDMGGAVLPGMTAGTDVISNVQSVSLDLPLSRTPLNKLGNRFSYARTIDTPITATLTVNAQLTDTSTGMLSDLLCTEQERDISIKMRTRCGSNDGDTVFAITLKGANLDSQNMSSTIGDNKTVDLTFSVPAGTDAVKGVFLSGKGN